MTGRAVGRIPRVIKRGHPRRKRRRGLVTGLARVASSVHVIRRFRHDAPARSCPSMTGRTAGHDPRVIHRGPGKRRRRFVARLAGRGVVGKWFAGLAPRRRAVMTGGAVPVVIPRDCIRGGHKNPIRRAHLGGRISHEAEVDHVRRRLPTGLDPVVTGRASAWPNSQMFEGCARPANRPMATVAGHGRRNMRYAGFPCAVVWLWHLEQVPGATPLWVKNAGVQFVVR